MITFFRRIRRGLLGSGHAQKYFFYAIGETALVVIGILIALQINNWNEWEKDRNKEIKVLQSLEDNFVLNIQTLESDTENLELMNRSARITISVLANKLPYVDSLGTHFHLARVPKQPLSISLAGYEQYKDSGYEIILNDNLKQELINYFESTFPKWQTTYNQVNYMNESFYDYHVPLFLYKTSTLEPIDIKSLYSDQYFVGWLKAYEGGRITLIEMEQNLIAETQRVLHLIRDELNGADPPR